MLSKRRPDRVLILGSGLPAERIARVIAKHGIGYQIVGFVNDQESLEPRAKSPEPCSQHQQSNGSGRGSLGSSGALNSSAAAGNLVGSGPLALNSPRLSILGSMGDLQTIVERVRPDRIAIALTERRGKLPVRECLAFRANGIVVEDWVELYERITGRIAIESLSPGSFLFSKVFDTSKLQSRLLRCLDVFYATVAIVLTAPLMALIAAAIKLDSEGPVLFIHERMGYKGRPFKLLKFRTMAPSSGKTSEWARDNEARVTRVGRILRKYRLDELPQFVNILFGQMSLIGPRPHPVTNAGLFFDEIPYYLVRAKVRPGVTGWAQIRFGYANDLDEETEKMRYDLYYIKHQSVLFDLRILFETVWIVLFGRGSEGTTGESDYEVSRNAKREHEYGWQTTFKDSFQHAAVGIPHSAFSTAPETGSARPFESVGLELVEGGARPNGSQHSAFSIQPQAFGAHPVSATSNAGRTTQDGSSSTLDGSAFGAWRHRMVDPSDLSFYDALERQIIAAEIREQLGHEPLIETRNRRRLHHNSLAPWELRADKFRIFYEAEEDSHQVTVVAVGHKEGDRLFLRGQEFAI